ncbi:MULTISPECIES: ABC transporter permease [Arthrobacter]|uniref:ABC transporter permease n=2 Tax=Arthrobacter TaxID=1663 RepID=A0ABU9KNF8_9MICC|nr:ABC transporter permease [Arthrobacter sp. YJM1]MDP5228200.1 ABC transporter permease [Arthrobacter sp. YJM1]
MFLALRDIRFAKGRFVLMGGVVALITVLLVMLSGLTAGLAHQSTSAIGDLPAGRVVFGAPKGTDAKASYADSEVTPEQATEWSKAAGSTVIPLGISQGKLRTGKATDAAADGARTANAAFFGSETVNGEQITPVEPGKGEVVLSQSLATSLDLAQGGTLNSNGLDLTVKAVVPDEWYSHMAVAWVGLADWQQMNRGRAATALVAPGVDAAAAQRADSATAMVSVERNASFQALESFKSENGSLLLIQAFLYGISALVVGAFLSIWTVQRTRDIAVLKALGATQGYVLKDALAQALSVLISGTVLGAVVGGVGGWFASQAAPFVLGPMTVAVPVVGIVLLGLAGSALAVRKATRVDPLLALGGS